MKPSSRVILILFFFYAFSLGFSEQKEDLCFIGCEKPKDSDKSLEDKIKRIEIPQLNLFNTPLREAMNLLSAQSRKLDSKETIPDAKGVNIIVLDQGAPAPSLTIKLNQMSLEKTLDFITEMVGWTYEVRKDAIVVMKEPRGGLGFPQGLKLEFFEVPQDIINRMTGVGAGVPPDPFSGFPKKIDPSGKVKQYLTNAGVIFDERKGHRFIFDGFQIIATHEQEALDSIRAILLGLDDKVAKQIEAQFKILEVPLGALEKVLEKAFGPRILMGQGHFQIESRLANATFFELRKMDGFVLKSLPRLVAMDGLPASFQIGEEVIYPTGFIPPEPVASSDSKPDQPFAPIPQFDTVAPDDEQPGFRMVGTKIELTARHEPKYDRVTVELAQKITESKGFEEYGAGTKVPKFWTWRLNTTVILKRSHTMIFRGPASDEKREIIIFLEASVIR
ncbi:MAG: hypothetical protein CMI31_07970 [Opitutae bacterium]|nr:hypothetical protein [Opitutae bacterium]